MPRVTPARKRKTKPVQLPAQVAHSLAKSMPRTETFAQEAECCLVTLRETLIGMKFPEDSGIIPLITRALAKR
jgi:hypothetical protein